MSERKITTEEQYQRALEWLVKKAQEIEHPLLDEQKRKELMQKYDYVTEKVLEYKREQSAKRTCQNN